MTAALGHTGRCLLLTLRSRVSFSDALRDSTTIVRTLLTKTEMAHVRHLGACFHVAEVARRRAVPSGKTSAAWYCTQNGVTVCHPDGNLPSEIQNLQQENSVTLTQKLEVILEDLDAAPSLSALEHISEDEAAQIEVHLPIPTESFSLQDYVDHSETLQKLVMLGVDLSKIETRPNVGNVLLRLDFDKDVSKILFFLKDVGLEDRELGPFITKNPFILSNDLEVLHQRVEYLRMKKFSKQAVARIVSRAPYLLNFSVERLDNRLGFFQKELALSAEKTRHLITRFPRMVTGSLEPVKENLKVFEIELGFRKNEIQHIVFLVPKILTSQKKRLTETFDYVHNTMGIPHHMIAKFPQIFNTRLLRLKERHQFLTFLGRAIYDPTKPSYVSLDKLASLPDDCFCEQVAKASIMDWEQFLKTL